MNNKKGALGLLLAALALLCGCAQQAQPVPELLEPVGSRQDTAIVQRGEICELAAYDFAVTPETQAVRYEMDGQVDRVCAVLGQAVQAGDVLLLMDVEEAQRQLDELERQMEYDRQDGELTIKMLQLDVDICKYEMQEENRDYAHGGLAEENKQEELKRLETALRQEQERQALNRAQQEQQRQELLERTEHAALLAPCDGTVLYVAHPTGGSAQAGSTALVLARTDELVLQGEYLSQSLVESADGVWALVGDGRAELEYLPMDEQEYVSLLLSGEEMTSRFAFADGVPEGVRAGDYAAVVVKTDQRQDVLWLPPGALCRDAAGEYVYIPGENGGKVRQNVKTGARTTTAVEITQGLSGGDVVYVQ